MNNGRPWLRLYTRIADDAKLLPLSEAMRWRFVVVLALRGRGDVPTTDDRLVAALLRISPKAATETRRALVGAQLIDDNWNPIAWDFLQYESDTSTPRVRAHRQRQRSPQAKRSGNVSETVQSETDQTLDPRPQTQKGAAAGASPAHAAAAPATSCHSEPESDGSRKVRALRETVSKLTEGRRLATPLLAEDVTMAADSTAPQHPGVLHVAK